MGPARPSNQSCHGKSSRDGRLSRLREINWCLMGHKPKMDYEQLWCQPCLLSHLHPTRSILSPGRERFLSQFTIGYIGCQSIFFIIWNTAGPEGRTGLQTLSMHKNHKYTIHFRPIAFHSLRVHTRTLRQHVQACNLFVAPSILFLPS